ncbi:MAG: glycosyltransferase family 4 protein [Terracoccus sp.]
MRILQVSDGYPPVVGGLEVYVESLSRALADEGHEVVVATLARPGWPARETLGGIAVFRLGGLTQHLPGAGHDPGQLFHPPVPDPPIVWQLQALVRRYRPDVIHAHGWMMHSCLPLRRGTAALVVHLHEYGLSCVKKTMMTPSGPCRLGPGLRRCPPCAAGQYRGVGRAGLISVSLRAERPMYRRVDAFVAISNAVADTARTVIPHRHLLTVIPTAVADDLGQVAELTPAPPWIPNSPYLLFVGALGPHKGIDVLLRARSLSTSGLPLVVIGTPRSDTPDLDDPAVIVRRDVAHDQVMAVWRRACVGVVPSVWPEPFGQVAVECQSVGTPVIVSGTGGLLDIVTDDVNGVVVPPGDPVALADAIDRLAADEALRVRLGEAGRISATAFTMSSLLPELHRVYAHAVTRRHAERHQW